MPADRIPAVPYRVCALTVAGEIRRPFVASITEPPLCITSGSQAHQNRRTEKFDFRGILSIGSMAAEVGDSWMPAAGLSETFASCTLENISILGGIVRAERLVAKLILRQNGGHPEVCFP